ncbi:RNA polymerase II large subunit CTD [Penicillium cf. griseofulvum]|nr:RNA polymerase II large subunit CTD [Penicillium cf. griseofulvum]
MATPHSVVIPKAAFAACLLRPDPTSVPHNEISHFHACLERALSHCSPVNIQNCKAWLLRFVAFSSSRVGGLVNYLEALAASLHPQPTGSKVSSKRQRLHILYLINDILHHCKYHLDTTSTFSIVSGSLQLHLVNLVGYAATCDRKKNPRHHRRLDDLLDIWSEHDYFHPELVHKLREVVIIGGPPPSNDAANESDPAKKPDKNVPFIVPSTHGDPLTRWHEVRVGNIYPHIIPDSTLPIQPDSAKPIQLLAGPADKKSIDALKSFLGHVNEFFDPETTLDDKRTDTDEVGQTVIRGENTPDILDGQHYYGWTLEFCQSADSGSEDSRGRSPSRSRSRSGSRTYHKRRRYADSSFSQSESESSGPRSYRHGIRHRHDARSRSRSPRRSPRRSPHRSRSRESSYTPRESSTSHFPPPHQSQHPSASTSSIPPAYPPYGS